MQGANFQYNLFAKLKHKDTNLVELEDVTEICRHEIGGYGQDFFKHKNILFILSNHARGRTFRIWLYEKEDVTDYLSDERLEVYGIVQGHPGWDEIYGWKHEGKWKVYINWYINSLQLFLEDIEKENSIVSVQQKEEETKALEEKIKKFNEVFEFPYVGFSM